MASNKNEALYKGKRHYDAQANPLGGIKVEVDGEYMVEVEGGEYKICTDAYHSDKVLEFKNKTNKEVLDYIHNDFSCTFKQGEADSGDFILCRLVVLDPKKHDRKGTVRQILDEMQSEKSCRVSIGKKKMKHGGRIEATPEELEKRWHKKKEHISKMADTIKRLRLNLTKDIKGDDERIRLTALAIAVMDKTAERVGNSDSEQNGHFGITGFKKSHISIDGNTVRLNYVGKSGVEHEKQFSDELIASELKKAIKHSDCEFVFCTNDGFRVKSDKINRYLSEFGVTAKDIRGYSANRWIIDKLHKIEPEDVGETEAKRKRKFNKVLKFVAGKVGHGASTLRKHYMTPELEEEFVKHGKIIDLSDFYKGGGKVSLSKTPAPKKDRVYGSEKNIPNSASDLKKASHIVLSDTIIKLIEQKAKAHNESNPTRKVTANALKAVLRRGMGAYSVTHRPNISGGKPNSRTAWGLARVNAFLFKAQHGYSKSGNYKQDDDLLDELKIKHKSYEDGGEMEKGAEIAKPNQQFMKWFIEWRNQVAPEMSIYIHLPTILTDYEEGDDIVYLTEFKKRYLSIDAKPYLQKILDKADYYGVSIYLEPVPIIEGLPKKKKEKITVQYLTEYYKRFGFDKIDGSNYMVRKHKRYEAGGNIDREKHNTVGCIIYHPEHGYLILQRAVLGEDTDLMWHVLSGGVDEGETLEQTVAREISEEIGYEGAMDIEYIESKEFDDYDFHYFFVRLTDPIEVKIDSENNDYAWVDDIKEMSDFNLIPLLEEYLVENTNHLATYSSGGSIEDEHKAIYRKWKQLVNMSRAELEHFYKSEEGQEAGLTAKKAHNLGIHYGRESARWILKMKSTPSQEWTPNMWKWAKRQISFISRMGGGKGKLYDESGKKTRKHLSLLIWGNNPEKKLKEGGGIEKSMGEKLKELLFMLHMQKIISDKLADAPETKAVKYDKSALYPNESAFVAEMYSDLESGVSHNKISAEKIGLKHDIKEKNRVKELTELAICIKGRDIALSELSDKEKYDELVSLYKNQPNLSHRTSESVEKQQYSTPCYIGYIMDLYCGVGKGEGLYFEPSAGNGMLTIAGNPKDFIVNEIDEQRLKDLRFQNYKEVLSQDGTLHFSGFDKKFDGMITNPPFGAIDTIEYQGFKVSSLEHQMALNALETIKDNGKAAIIIGGHTKWDNLGRIQAGKNREFFVLLNRLYNVEDVINIDGHAMYSRQGTSYDIRIILINGRRTTPAFPPLLDRGLSVNENNSGHTVSKFEDLWERVQTLL